MYHGQTELKGVAVSYNCTGVPVSAFVSHAEARIDDEISSYKNGKHMLYIGALLHVEECPQCGDSHVFDVATHRRP